MMNVKRFLRKEVFFLYILFPVLITAAILNLFKGPGAIFIAVVFVLLYVSITELVFRTAFRIVTGNAYQLIPKVPFKKIYIEPHPYLPFVYKKRFLCQKQEASRYPLNRDRGYSFAQLTTNNYRHINGPNGDRDIVVPKPKGLIRINCMGGSTTAGYITYKGKNYSYPMELEDILKSSLPGLDIEVNNCGQGGYTTAEMLIKFLLSTIDTEPDIVVIYHAYNDLGASLTADFESDYSHARVNLGEVYHMYKYSAMIPAIPLASWNFMVNYCLFSQNIRYSIPGVVSRGRMSLDNEFKGLDTYRRNIEHIIDICRARGTDVVLSTFTQYLYPRIAGDKAHLKYREGLRLENAAMRDIADRYNLPLVPNDTLIPAEERYFIDSVHFSHEGMRLLAKNLAAPVIDYIKKRLSGGGTK